MKTFDERYGGERFGDGGVSEQCKQCKDCLFRDRTAVEEAECGWFKSVCKMFAPPDYKPSEIMDDKENCEFREVVN